MADHEREVKAVSRAGFLLCSESSGTLLLLPSWEFQKESTAGIAAILVRDGNVSRAMFSCARKMFYSNGRFLFLVAEDGDEASFAFDFAADSSRFLLTPSEIRNFGDSAANRELFVNVRPGSNLKGVFCARELVHIFSSVSRC